MEEREKLNPEKKEKLNPEMGIVETIGLMGELQLELRDSKGRLKERRIIKNTITNVGIAEVIGLMIADVGGTAFDYIAIGTGTPTATALGAEITTGGGARRGGADVVGTRITTTTTNDTGQLETTFTFTDSFAVTEEGVFNAATEGTMIASQSFAVLNVASEDILKVTHKIKGAAL
ncbi:MAG TPA: hypothetical protein ENN27_02945 [Candidatus Atribacteria bacterium]|nr:hypothetical protein [Candidatus Atribacteria bacterium]